MPQPTASQFDRANMLLAQGSLDQAIEHYRQVIALKPNYAEAHSNLGVALMAAGRPIEAVAAYRAALAIKPKLANTMRNLGRVLVSMGNVMEALALARRSLDIEKNDEIKAFFAQCIRSVPSPAPHHPALDGIEPLLARALSDAWGRPEDLAGLAADLVKRKFAANNPLLRALLESAPVRDIALERILTQERRALLAVTDGDRLVFACAMARQCFINEYVFVQADDEIERAAKLRDALAGESRIAPIQLATVAAYFPLHSLPYAERLLLRNWPAPVNALLDQQVRQPLRERRDRDVVAVLTSIDDAVSQAVQRQYEEMPYPRWVKAAPLGKPVTLDQHLRGHFPFAPLRPLEKSGRTDILIAGCGTGQHAIETARRYAGARVLAVDLSISSLCYARRMTRELSLSNIEYAQADILKLANIDRRFDLIEAVGVLHHLADPETGWRALLSLLNPNGLMLIGLYSEHARREVNLARRFIAEHGYGPSADDIRRCRQNVMALPDGADLKDVTKFGDFYATSTCRDLLFHVQEHQFTLPRIKTFLTENALTLIGFVADPAIQQQYRATFPEDAAMTGLERWDVFETAHPHTFADMYQFWVQRAS